MRRTNYTTTLIIFSFANNLITGYITTLESSGIRGKQSINEHKDRKLPVLVITRLQPVSLLSSFITPIEFNLFLHYFLNEKNFFATLKIHKIRVQTYSYYSNDYDVKQVNLP